MDNSISEEVKSLRSNMGMNRREFCDYYEIPYRTMVDWEAGKRKMPEYLLRLMEYKARMEHLIMADKEQNAQTQDYRGVINGIK